MRAAFRAVMAAALIAVGLEGVVVLLFVDTLRRYGLFDRASGRPSLRQRRIARDGLLGRRPRVDAELGTADVAAAFG